MNTDLDDNDYQERPLLPGGGTRFVNQWTDTQWHPALIRVVLKDIYDHVDPAHREYFRTTREQRFGMSIDAMHAGRGRVCRLYSSLANTVPHYE